LNLVIITIDMKNLSKLFVLLVIALLGVSSCGDEPEGKWDKMKWTNVDNLMNYQGVYLIPAVGGVYTFQCRNYGHPWIESVTVDGVTYNSINGLPDRLEFRGEWCRVKFDGNKLYITADPLPESVESRVINVRVTAGDIFDTLSFSQQKGVNP